MPAQLKQSKAAVVTAERGWFNLDLSVQKPTHWINEAGKAGCKLVAFPEVCLSPRLFNSCTDFQTPSSSVRTNNVKKGSLATRIGYGR